VAGKGKDRIRTLWELNEPYSDDDEAGKEQRDLESVREGMAVPDDYKNIQGVHQDLLGQIIIVTIHSAHTHPMSLIMKQF